jgi:hypothetical protein
MLQDAHLPWAALRAQHLVETGPKDVALGAAVTGHRGHHALPPQGAKPREVTAPMARLRRVGALAPGGARLAACHGLRAPGLIKTEPIGGGDLPPDVANVHALGLAVGALWLDGAARLFGQASGAGAAADSGWGDCR